MSIARLFWRLVVLTFALVVEGVVVTGIGLYAAARFAGEAAFYMHHMPPADAGDAFAYVVGAGLVTLWAAAHALTPWVIAVGITEVLRWRGVLTHVLAGALVALTVAIVSGAILIVPALQIIVALGLIGGFLHWLIAGRNAGRWSEPDLPPPPPPRMPGPAHYDAPPPGAQGPTPGPTP